MTLINKDLFIITKILLNIQKPNRDYSLSKFSH